MKVQEYVDGSTVRDIIKSMITDKYVLAKLSAIWAIEPKPFEAQWCNQLGRMCISFYEKYGRAPKREILSRIRAWGEKNQGDPNVISDMEAAISHIGDRFKREGSVDYAVERAVSYFEKVRVLREAERIKEEAESGRVDDAIRRLALSRLEVNKNKGLFLFNDEEEMAQYFDTPLYGSLVQYPSAATEFFQKSFARGCFVAFEGPEKSGKSWWLLDLAFRALRHHAKVAVFEVGDLTKRQVMERFYRRAAQRPMEKGEVDYPVAFKAPDEVRCEPRSFEKDLTGISLMQAIAKFRERTIKSQEPYFWLNSYPAGTMTVAGIESVLNDMEREDGWVPDVVIVDYADLLAPERSAAKFDRRDQINETWKALRSLSSKKEMLLATATQANRGSYKARVLRLEHSSEDKRKAAHVTALWGINRDDVERDMQVTRLNWIAGRESAFSPTRCLYAAGCFPIGNPMVKCEFPKKILDKASKVEEEEEGA